MKRVSLSKEDFETLISGGVVEQNGVEIILQDIGYVLMRDLLEDKIKTL